MNIEVWSIDNEEAALHEVLVQIGPYFFNMASHTSFTFLNFRVTSHSALEAAWVHLDPTSKMLPTMPVPANENMSQLHARREKLQWVKFEATDTHNKLFKRLRDLKKRRNEKQAWAEKLARQTTRGSLGTSLKCLIGELNAEIDAMDDAVVEFKNRMASNSATTFSAHDELNTIEETLADLKSVSLVPSESDPLVDLEFAMKSAQQARDYLDWLALAYWKDEAHAALEFLLAG